MWSLDDFLLLISPRRYSYVSVLMCRSLLIAHCPLLITHCRFTPSTLLIAFAWNAISSSVETPYAIKSGACLE